MRSVQDKVSITLFGVLAAMGVLSYIVLSLIVAPAFSELEIDEAETNLARAANAIANDLEYLSAVTGDWGAWDDAFDYVRGAYPAFEDSNLVRPTLDNLNLDLLAIFDANGELLWGQIDNAQAPTDLSLLGTLNAGTESHRYLVTHTVSNRSIDGLFNTRLGPMMISSWPITRSSGTSPIVGTILMGQLLDEERMLKLRERTEVMLDWRTTDNDPDLVASIAVPLNRAGDANMHHASDSREIVSSGLLVDALDHPLLLLDVRTQRQISALGNSTVNGALAFLVLAGLIIATVAWFMLRTVIVRPLQTLSTHITDVRRSGDLSRRLNARSDDEIGVLADEFDKLTDELQEVRRLLLDQSFKAGKADYAAEVLHNIRNAMTPLINSLDRAGKDLGAGDALKVEQAVAELESGECPPERAAKLLEYIQSAFRFVVARIADTNDRLNVAARQARQVEEILVDQEKHAKVSPVVEDLDLGEVLNEAALVIPDACDELELELVNHVRGCNIRGHRVGLMQVLGNLILNAYEAIRRTRSSAGRIEMLATREAGDGEDMVRLTVRDTGCGFDDDLKSRIFQRGFSSKQGHMSGLGLHWCANALASMGGRIQAESRGPGQGAEIHVLLPAGPGEKR